VHVLCVLKSGGEYRAEHAARLYDQFLRHAPAGCEFLCLTNLLQQVEDLNVPCATLAHGWPGWWSKIEVLKIPGPCLFLDLDVTIVADLGLLLDVAREQTFVVCANFWIHDPHLINSSVMAWAGGGVDHIYQSFSAAPAAHMATYRTRERWGDQAFIADFSGGYQTWQELEPGAVVSFKRGVLQGESLAGMIVCVSHGKPKPWEPYGADAWLRQHGKLE
jgi:hypothetical protein